MRNTILFLSPYLTGLIVWCLVWLMLVVGLSSYVDDRKARSKCFKHGGLKEWLKIEEEAVCNDGSTQTLIEEGDYFLR